MRYLELLKRKEKKKKVMVFVNYKYWYCSCQNIYHMKPDPLKWKKMLEERCIIDHIVFFIDRSVRGMEKEFPKLENMGTIIETKSGYDHSKKDLNDFVMLDSIYQFVAENPRISTYVFLVGDGRFNSVVKYLVQKRKKEVILYGVKNSVSSQMKETATEYFELPFDEEFHKADYPMIVENLASVLEKPKMISTYRGTIQAVARQHSISERQVQTALDEMMGLELVYQRKMQISPDKCVKVLAANWKKLMECGLWMREQ